QTRPLDGARRCTCESPCSCRQERGTCGQILTAQSRFPMSKFFIERPIFAWVIAIFIMVAGAVSITQLPIAQYPAVAPPTIQVSAAYPGATAQVLEDSVL